MVLKFIENFYLFISSLFLMFSILLKKCKIGGFKIYYSWYIFLFKLLRSYIHTMRMKLLTLYYWTQTCRSMKPTKTCVFTRSLKFCHIHDVDNYACGVPNNFYKTCGAQKFIRILRSWRCLLLCLRRSQRFQQTLRSYKTYWEPAELTMSATMPAALSTILIKPAEL